MRHELRGSPAERRLQPGCPAVKARRPTFKKKRLTGDGSFRAAAAVRDIHYDGKRRIRLPYLGSVKLAHTLPDGVIHEAHISFRNGQWLLSTNYWKPPVEPPEPDSRITAGAVDTGINPLGTDSEGQTWENPKAYYTAEKRLRRWQHAQARRTRGSRGSWEAQRRIDKLHQRVGDIRKNAQHLMTSQLAHKYRNLVIEDLNVASMMRGKTPKAQADASMGEIMRDLPSHFGKRSEHSETQSPDTDHPSTEDRPLDRLLGGPNCDCLRNYQPKPIGPIKIGFFQIEADGSRPPNAADRIRTIIGRARDREQVTKPVHDRPTAQTGDGIQNSTE